MRVPSRAPALARPLATLGLACTVCTPVAGQSTWEALLSIDPFPSPYYSDWEANPNLGSLTVLNHGPADGTIRVAFSIVDGTNRVIAQGSSEPEFVAAGAAAIFDSPYELAGTTSHDAEIERLASRTGRLPEGEYTACAAATDVDGFILAEACLGFSVFYPDPPLLLAPLDGAVLDRQDEFFQWTPVQVPAGMEPQYVLRVAEVLEGQTPAEALAANIPHHESLDLFAPNLQYPFEATPLEPGKTYAWSVRAFDLNGYPVSANDGQSEIWTFGYDDGTVPTRPTAGRTFALTNDVTTASAPTTTPTTGGLGEICTSWSDPPDVFDLGMAVPIFGFLEGRIEFGAELYQDDPSRTWALLGTADDRRYLAYGDCERGGSLGGLRWLATRKVSGTQPLLEFLGLDPASGGAADMSYAVTIVSLGEADLTVPTGWTGAVDFLDGHEIEVGMGINLFGVLDLNGQAIATLFDWLGYPEARLELQGRVGPQSEWSLGGMVGQRTDLDQGIVREREWLRLSARLPEKAPGVGGDWFETMQVGIDVVLEDNAATEGGAGARVPLFGWRLPGFAEVTAELNVALSVTLTGHDGVEYTGALGPVGEYKHMPLVSWLRASDSTSFGRGSPDLDMALTLSSDGRWVLNESLGLYIGEPEIELKVDSGFVRAIRERSAGALDWDVEIEGRLGFEDAESSARIVLGLGRGANRPAGETASRSRTKMETIRANIARLEEQIRSAEAADSTARAAELSRTLAIERNALAMWEHVGDAPSDTTAATPANPSQWRWKAGVYFGNVSFGDLYYDLKRLFGGSP